MEFQHLGYLIIYSDNGIQSISTHDRNLTWDLANLWTNNVFDSYTNHLNESIDYQSIVKVKILELCELAKSIKKTNGVLYCHISTHIFSALANYPKSLSKFHLYMNAIYYWKFILRIINDWTKENPENEIHKGAVYGFIAEISMKIGDYEMAFIDLHRAVREDFNIEEHIPNYGRSAPGYKIITLRPQRDHWMWGFVKQVRDGLAADIQDFDRLFPQYLPFSIKTFDELFIENKFFDSDGFYENLKITISFYIWQNYYYFWKVGESEQLSDFDNLTRLPKLFAMCVTFETLANKILSNEDTEPIENKKPKRDTLLIKMERLYKFINGNKDYTKTLHPLVKDRDDDIGDLLIQLLDYDNHIFETESIDEIDRCVLIYTLIRNFTAHNTKSIEVIGEKYFKISKSLFFLFLVFLKELNEQGKLEMT